MSQRYNNVRKIKRAKQMFLKTALKDPLVIIVGSQKITTSTSTCKVRHCSFYQQREICIRTYMQLYNRTKLSPIDRFTFTTPVKDGVSVLAWYVVHHSFSSCYFTYTCDIHTPHRALDIKIYLPFLFYFRARHRNDLCDILVV